MDELIEEIGKGFLRGVGYLLVEILYGTICYWVGWPICRVLTLGRYPRDREQPLPEKWNAESFLCSSVGFIVLIVVALYLVDAFAQ